MRYADAKAWVQQYLSTLKDTSGQLVYTTVPMISPGPSASLLEQKASPNEMVFINVGGGAAQSVEGMFDNPFLSLRIVGRQNIYQSAEDLAHYLDIGLLAIPCNGFMGTARVKPLVRSGGMPALLSRDDAGRYHFTSSYIVETQTEGVLT